MTSRDGVDDTGTSYGGDNNAGASLSDDIGTDTGRSGVDRTGIDRDGTGIDRDGTGIDRDGTGDSGIGRWGD